MNIGESAQMATKWFMDGKEILELETELADIDDSFGFYSNFYKRILLKFLDGSEAEFQNVKTQDMYIESRANKFHYNFGIRGRSLNNLKYQKGRTLKQMVEG